MVVCAIHLTFLAIAIVGVFWHKCEEESDPHIAKQSWWYWSGWFRRPDCADSGTKPEPLLQWGDDVKIYEVTPKMNPWDEADITLPDMMKRKLRNGEITKWQNGRNGFPEFMDVQDSGSTSHFVLKWLPLDGSGRELHAYKLLRKSLAQQVQSRNFVQVYGTVLLRKSEDIDFLKMEAIQGWPRLLVERLVDPWITGVDFEGPRQGKKWSGPAARKIQSYVDGNVKRFKKLVDSVLDIYMQMFFVAGMVDIDRSVAHAHNVLINLRAFESGRDLEDGKWFKHYDFDIGDDENLEGNMTMFATDHGEANDGRGTLSALLLNDFGEEEKIKIECASKIHTFLVQEVADFQELCGLDKDVREMIKTALETVKTALETALERLPDHSNAVARSILERCVEECRQHHS